MLDFFEYMRKIQVIIMKAMGPLLRAEGFSKTEVFLLMSVYHKKTFRTTEIAKMADMPASTLTGLVDRLVEKGLIVRENDITDRRSVLLTGTPELEKTITRMMGLFSEKLSEILKPVPKELLDQTISNLNQVYELLSKESECN